MQNAIGPLMSLDSCRRPTETLIIDIMINHGVILVNFQFNEVQRFTG